MTIATKPEKEHEHEHEHEKEWTLSMPTPADFHALSVLQAMAFPEQEQRNNYLRYQRYHRECPLKLEHCRIVKLRTRTMTSESGTNTETDTENKNHNTTVVAACQLQLRPRRSDRVVDVFIEWIGCHPDHRGKGVGTMLLDWAGTFAKETMGASSLGLYMIRSNTNARRLYERNGFAAVRGPNHRDPNNNTNTNTNTNTNPNIQSKSRPIDAVSSSSSSSSAPGEGRRQRFHRNLDRLFGHWSVLQMEKHLC